MDIFKRKEIITEIYRSGGFSKAAKTLHIAQPSLSVMVSSIEKEIGAKLFDRSINPVRLTQVGEKYLECCENVSIIEEDFMNYVNEIKGLETGEISLGGNTLYISNIIPKILSVYDKAHPGIHVRLYDHDSPSLINMLYSGELDIAIDNLPQDDSKLDRHYLGTEYLLIAVPAEYRLNNRLSDYAYSYFDITRGLHVDKTRPYLNNLSLFRNQPFILLQEGFDTRKRCNAIFEDYRISVQSKYEFNQLSSAFGMAASGLGITIVSDTLIKYSPDWGSKMKYYAIQSPESVRDVFYYTRKNRMMSHALQEFIDISYDYQPLTLQREINPIAVE